VCAALLAGCGAVSGHGTRQPAGSSASAPTSSSVPTPVGSSATAPPTVATSDSAAQTTPNAPAIDTAQLGSVTAPAMCDRPEGQLVDGKLPVADPDHNGGTEIIGYANGDPSYAVGANATMPGGVVAVVFTCSTGGVGWPNVIGLYGIEGGSLKLVGSIDLAKIDDQEHSNVMTMEFTDVALHLVWRTNDPSVNCPVSDTPVWRSGDFVLSGSGAVTLRNSQTIDTLLRPDTMACMSASNPFVPPSAPANCPSVAQVTAVLNANPGSSPAKVSGVKITGCYGNEWVAGPYTYNGGNAMYFLHLDNGAWSEVDRGSVCPAWGTVNSDGDYDSPLPGELQKLCMAS